MLPTEFPPESEGDEGPREVPSIECRIVQCLVFLTASLILGYTTFLSIMVGVWGVAIHPLLYLAFFSSVGLLASSFICLQNARAGRMIAMASLFGIGTVWIPSVSDLVPQHNRVIASWAYALFAGYFLVVAFALFFPRPWRFSWLALLITCAVPTVYGGAVYFHRFDQGEYARPGFAYFYWRNPQSDRLTVEDPYHWIDSETMRSLEAEGIRGQLAWVGATGAHDLPNRVIILAQQQPRETFRINYPRMGTLVHAYDGSNWLKFPRDAATYDSYATLEADGTSTFLTRREAGGIHGSRAFSW